VVTVATNSIHDNNRSSKSGSKDLIMITVIIIIHITINNTYRL